MQIIYTLGEPPAAEIDICTSAVMSEPSLLEPGNTGVRKLNTYLVVVPSCAWKQRRIFLCLLLLLAEGALTIIVILLPPVSKALAQIKKAALE